MTWTLLRPVYHGACPNCGGPAAADRLSRGLPCSQCISDDELSGLPSSYYELVEFIGRKLSEKNRLRGYWYLYSSVATLKEFESFFQKATGSSLWSAQRTWAKRLLQDESLAIVAPTGVGKTTLLSTYALYRASHGARVYYLLPTENLAMQIENKLKRLAAASGVEARIVSYYSGLSKKRREESLSAIEAGNYDVLVTTTGFLSRRWDMLESTRFDVVLVDDVDAILRNSKNIDKLLMLLGFDEEAIAIAYTLLKKKIAASIAKVSGHIKRYEQLLHEIEDLETKLSLKLLEKTPGQLVIASATGRAYGLKPKLFRELLGFDIGRVYDYTRSIANFYLVDGNPVEKIVDIVQRMGPGGLVFVAKRYGKDVARQIAERLNQAGIRAGLALAGRRVLDRFAMGEYDILVGVASYYGVIVRGIDMPHRILYTLFVGVPSQAMSADKALLSPFRIVRAAVELGIEGSEELARKLSKTSPGEQTALRIALSSGEQLEGRLAELLSELTEARRKVLRRLYEVLEPGSSLVVGGILYKHDGSEIIAIMPDAATYVQASGRASRMLGSIMTHGVSIIIESEEELIKLLSQRLRRYLDNVEFNKLDWNHVEEELEKARISRSKRVGRKVNIETCLIVVESPTKAKTIASFFGKPVRRRIGSIIVYETTFFNHLSGKIHVATITASAGHLYDLSIDGEGIHGVEVVDGEVRPVYKPIKRCLSCGHQFSSSSSMCPRCGSSNIVSKHDIVEALRQLASEAEVVYIATDPDVEGEKIAYDIKLFLQPYARGIKRIELHEITRSELMRALASPRDIDIRLAYAQIVRRIEDRWIGFGLSQHLWRVFGKHWLGAGRVQTPVLGWIIKRYEEWRANIGYNVYVKISEGPLLKLHYEDSSLARSIAREIETYGLKIIDVEETVTEISPPPPYTTESLIYDASRLMGYSAQKTMRIAQELFEAGLITYHRTDSTHVSGLGQSIAREYLASKENLNDFQPRSWGPQGHHEAIRPTKPIDGETLRKLIALGELRVPITMRESHYRLYDLIFRRFIASQARPARLVRRRIVLGSNESKLLAELEVYVAALEEGFHRYYPMPRVYPALADLRRGDVIGVERVVVKRGSTIYLYSHGDVVSLMKERGLGRPSTYAKIIDALNRHGYIIESKYRKRLIPTKLGIEVYEYLEANYNELVSEERTRKLNEEIEAIASGRISPLAVINELYNELEHLLEEPIILKPVKEMHAGHEV
ncbi:reverse gyrase [Pyrodictium delaneyi]|uniref:Reverse gyrase n=1 Tax=Pyrodictium delaneyi TaxID=1273541 RepID=A0A211YQ73_9CREN|nr:reverse gyrase [Pyrodictium delaneyi]OWJ55064.1 reverse gyrase [Pyrodictium delaneyi]